jgi:hypothetical protein
MHNQGRCLPLLLAPAGRLRGLQFCRAQRRQPKRRPDGNAGDDHQPFDSGEPGAFPAICNGFHLFSYCVIFSFGTAGWSHPQAPASSCLQSYGSIAR